MRLPVPETLYNKAYADGSGYIRHINWTKVYRRFHPLELRRDRGKCASSLNQGVSCFSNAQSLNSPS
jgi:hypothetical protein